MSEKRERVESKGEGKQAGGGKRRRTRGNGDSAEHKLVSTLAACLGRKDVEGGATVVTQALDGGMKLRQRVYNMMMALFATGAAIDDARRFHERAKTLGIVPTEASFSNLIRVAAAAGRADDLVALLTEMKVRE